MIKILDIKPVGDFLLDIRFSSGDCAHFDGLNYLSSRSGSLLEPLRQPDFFARCFVDAGALCWPNGLELSADRVFSLSQILA